MSRLSTRRALQIVAKRQEYADAHNATESVYRDLQTMEKVHSEKQKCAQRAKSRLQTRRRRRLQPLCRLSTRRNSQTTIPSAFCRTNWRMSRLEFATCARRRRTASRNSPSFCASRRLARRLRTIGVFFYSEECEGYRQKIGNFEAIEEHSEKRVMDLNKIHAYQKAHQQLEKELWHVQKVDDPMAIFVCRKRRF